MCFICAIGLDKTKLSLHCKFFGYIANFVTYIRTDYKLACGYSSSSSKDEETTALPRAVAM
jgi:hypothetical protein